MNLNSIQILSIFTGVMSGSLGAILLKLGANHLATCNRPFRNILFQIGTNPYLIGGMLLYAIPTLLWIWMLKTIPISTLQPLLSLTYVVTALLAMLFLKESIPPFKWLGIGIVLVGIVMISKS